jgi:hypothetical protein
LTKTDSKQTKLLLSCVFKPYGVTDEFGEALCTMELLNNQVTREQTIHSPRSNNLSFGLYLLAENVKVDTQVLDFPSWKDFTREVDRGQYTHIGITFIVPNVMRVKRMAQYVRQHSPGTKIILGGHGAAIPNLHEIVDCDEVCPGEGVAWLRSYFGERPDAPVIHPVIKMAVNSSIYGVPLLGHGGTILPGVGCQNGCRFCSTTHKFEKKYTAFLKTGRDIYNACFKAEEDMGVTEFGMMDENFCKNEENGRHLLAEMEKGKRAYTFVTFSSAEAITKMGVDFLVRMGVNMVWIGVESKANIFEKTKGIDLKALIADLQDHGISVLASAILFLEHHDKETIIEDIDWSVGLGSDLLQFMQFGPLPGTALYQDYLSKNKLLLDFPLERRHGQGFIWFTHPHFTQEESFEYLKNAFITKYNTHGPGVLNMAHSAIRGYLTVKAEIERHEAEKITWDPETLKYTRQAEYRPDPFLKLRLEAMKKNAIKFRPILTTTAKYGPNAESSAKSRMVIDLYNKAFGKPSFLDNVLELAVKIASFFEYRYFLKHGVRMRQPSTIRASYKNRLAVETNIAQAVCEQITQTLAAEVTRVAAKTAV